MAACSALSVPSVAPLLHPHESRLNILATLIGYFDESGSEDKPVFTVGGFVASEQQWKHFDGRWKAALDRRNVTVFHMSDFESGFGDFAGWSKPDRITLISQLAEIIKDTVILGVGHSVIVQDFKEVFCPNATPPEVIRSAYVFLFQSCLDDIVARLPMLDEERVSMVCEARAGVEGATVDKIQEIKRRVPDWETVFEGRPWFAEKWRFRPLQSADIIAYEGYKHVTNQFLADEALWPPRKLFLNLDASKRLEMGYYNKAQLENVRRRLAEAGQLWRLA